MSRSSSDEGTAASRRRPRRQSLIVMTALLSTIASSVVEADPPINYRQRPHLPHDAPDYIDYDANTRPSSMGRHTLVKLDITKPSRLRMRARTKWASSIGTIPRIEEDSVNSTAVLPGVVGFWHIGPGQKDGMEGRSMLVRQQLKELRTLPVYGKVKINYLLDGNPVDSATRQLLASRTGLTAIPLPEELRPYSDGPLYEFPTLLSLWQHCHANPEDLVFYIHSKSQETPRRLYEERLFSDYQGVIAQLRAGKWVYGASFCRVYPWCHIPGNFWWARCDHVNRLNKPFDPHYLSECVEHNYKGRSGHPYQNPPRGRFMAEYWILSDFLGPHPQHKQAKSSKVPLHNYCLHETYGDVCSHVVGAQEAPTDFSKHF